MRSEIFRAPAGRTSPGAVRESTRNYNLFHPKRRPGAPDYDSGGGDPYNARSPESRCAAGLFFFAISSSVDDTDGAIPYRSSPTIGVVMFCLRCATYVCNRPHMYIWRNLSAAEGIWRKPKKGQAELKIAILAKNSTQELWTPAPSKCHVTYVYKARTCICGGCQRKLAGLFEAKYSIIGAGNCDFS